tara:strand:- start:261 stop:389 length:129 start_codon:yes stop_codon:yes gene_type:complete
MYEIIYKGEVVDSAETLKEAKYLKREYDMAFNASVSIDKVKK